jgi:hypothetical protein
MGREPIPLIDHQTRTSTAPARQLGWPSATGFENVESSQSMQRPDHFGFARFAFATRKEYDGCHD